MREPGRRRLLWGAVLALWIVIPPALARGAATARSVILITIDTLRADHLSSHGYRRATSRNLDAFMARGVRFTQAFSTSSRTAPSHASLMTGLYPPFTTVGVRNSAFPLSADTVTLAEICRGAGLRTGAVVSNPVLARSLGLDQGFETYDDELGDRELARDRAEQIAEHTLAKARAALARLSGEPFFLWVHFQDPHGPYAPPAPWLDAFLGDSGDAAGPELPAGKDQSGYRSVPRYQAVARNLRVQDYIRRYDAEIAYLDSQLERLFAAVRDAGLLDDTLVVVTADHGEALGEDDYYFAHGHSLGIDQVHVPLAFVGAGLPGRVTLQTAVSNMAVFCTVLNALGLDASAHCGQSESLWPSLRAGREPTARVWFAASVTQWAAFRAGVFLRHDAYPADHPLFARPQGAQSGQVYAPSGERVVALDGASPAEGDIASLRAALAELITQAESVRPALDARRMPPAPLPPQQVDRLRALGYLQ